MLVCDSRDSAIEIILKGMCFLILDLGALSYLLSLRYFFYLNLLTSSASGQISAKKNADFKSYG